MSDQEEVSPEARLWSIPKQQPKGVGLGPIIMIGVITAFALGLMAVPCLSLRLQILSYAKDTGPLNFWQMTCDKEEGACVCRQGGSEIKGDEECTIAQDLKLRCRSTAADYLPPEPPPPN